MLTLRIEFLRGVCVSTSFNDRGQAEWPPHPARIFSALVDAWSDDEDAAAAAALRWLEAQPPPQLTATDAHHRSVTPIFVPVNDATVHRTIDARINALDDAERELAAASDAKAKNKLEKAASKARSALLDLATKGAAAESSPADAVAHAATRVLPAGRLRQARTFPTVVPHDPVVWMTWAQGPPPEHRAVLADLASRVHRIGHSSSLVTCRFEDASPAATHTPNEDGHTVLRWVEEGQHDRLQRDFADHRATEPRVLPSQFVRYGTVGASPESVPRSEFSDRWFVLERVGGDRLPSTRAPALTRALRNALMSAASQPVQPVLSGHSADGKPLDHSHAAFIALPFVGSRHADGRILGLAVALPREATREEEAYVARAIAGALQLDPQQGGTLRLVMGRNGVLAVRDVAGRPSSSSLREEAWCQASTRWVSATPIALDRNPGELHSADPGVARAAREAAEETVRRACVRIGLPEPVEVGLSPRPPIVGADHVRHHPPYPLEREKIRRVLVHARIAFDVPVRGPLLLGAGRYAGLGLMRPVRAWEHA